MFSRLFTPLIMFAAAFYVYNYNATHVGGVLLVPFLDFVPSLKGNLVAQGQASWQIMAALGAMSLVWNLVGAKRSKSPKDEPEQPDP